MFTDYTAAKGVTHITDAMGVSMTLIEGTQRALLFDTGYGTENVRAHVEGLTDKPVKVILSHGHHDHVLGARWFGETWIAQEDIEEFGLRTGTPQRMRVMQQAAEKGVAVPEDFLAAEIKLPMALQFDGKAGDFESCTEELGGRQVKVIHVPGHTPGSIVLYLPEERMLLTGDDWNPCTWVWFPSSVPVKEWRENMKKLLETLEKEAGGEVVSVLCPHQPMRREGNEIKRYLAYMTDDRLKNAPPAPMNDDARAREVRKEPEGWVLAFDYGKFTEE